jgi:hypothetical protein
MQHVHASRAAEELNYYQDQIKIHDQNVSAREVQDLHGLFRRGVKQFKITDPCHSG